MATIRELPSGRFQVIVRIKGYPTHSATFTKKTLARQWAAKIEHEMYSGRFRDGTSAEVKTLPEVLDWYLDNHTPRKAVTSHARDASRVKILKTFPGFKRATLASLTPETVVTFIDRRMADGVSADTVRKDLGVLRHAIDVYVALLKVHLPHGNAVATALNVMHHTRRMPRNPRRERRISPEEEQAILAQLPATMKWVFTLLIETGMRRGEVCAIRSEHIDWEGRTLLIPQTKTDQKRTIPLSGRALEALRQLPPRTDGRLLGYHPHSITLAVARVCEKLGIADLHVHDTRHECASRLFEKGWTIPEVAAVTGHMDWKSLQRYTNLRPEELAKKL